MDYEGPAGDVGFGLLIFESGKVWGVDMVGAHYDGDYKFNATSGKIDAVITATFEHGTSIVTGHTIGQEGAKVVITISLPKDLDVPASTTVSVLDTDVHVMVRKVREAPQSY